MRDIPLDFPIDGLSEDQARSKQEFMTSPDMVNMRDKDPVTGREQGGTREGLASVASVAADPVREIQVCQFDQRGSTFTQYAEDAQVEDWKVAGPLRAATRMLDIDVEGNRYTLDGRAGIAKYNKGGELVWKFVLPVDSQEHIVRALAVDVDGTFYAAVSEGYPQTKTHIWKFVPEGTGASVPNREWTIGTDDEPLGCYVERLRLRDGVLFANCNFPDTGKSTLRAYRLIDTAVPILAWERDQVPYPCIGMAVRPKDGAIFTTHPLNATRSYDPRSSNTQKIAVDWTPDRLTSWDVRKWCAFDPSDLDGSGDGNADFLSGDSIGFVYDKTDNGRNAYSYENAGLTAPTNCTPPTLNKSKQFAGQDTLVFSNPTAGLGNAHQALVSRPNATTNAGQGNSQNTFIPCYAGAKFFVLMVLRTTDTSATIRCPFGQIYTASSTYRGVFLNSDTTGGSGFTASAGKACLHQSLSGGGTAGPYAAYDTTDGFCVVAFTCHSDGTAVAADLNSVNGTDCTNETFTGSSFSTTVQSMLGRIASTVTGVTAPGAGINPFDGELGYFLCLRDYGGGSILSTTEFEQLEGWAHWRFGIAHKLPVGHPYKLKPPTADPLVGTTDSPYLYLTDTEQMVVKWDPNGGRPRWVVQDDSSSTGTGGLGLDVAVPDNGSLDFIFTMGKKGTGTGGTAAQILTRESVVRRIKDNGDSASLTGTGTWESRWGASPGVEPSYDYPKMCVSGIAANSEQDGSAASYLFVPYYTSVGPATDACWVYTTSGTASGTGTSTPPTRTIALSSGARAYACAVERYLPEYVPGQLNSLIDEFVTIGTPQEGSSTETIWNLKLVEESRTDTTPRGTYIAAVAGTALKKVTSAGVVSDPVAPPTLAGKNYTSVVAAFQRLWIADGTNYFTVDPRLADGFSKEWKSKTAGELPPGGRLLCYWNERILVARGMDPTILFGTATDDPTNCDVSPPELTGTEAFAIPLGEAINAMIPLSNDEVMIGTQTRRIIIRGDPARGGGIDRVGDVSGIAFGEAWCKDPQGQTYVFGSRGGVDIIGKGSISDHRIRRRLEDIDLGVYFVRLVWNWRTQGLHVFFIPQGTPTGTRSLSYYWSRRRGRWFEDDIAGVITSTRLIDGDGVVQRAVWCGFADGHIRRFSEDTSEDDGSPIFWRVVFPPIHSTERNSVIVSRPRFTLANEHDGATVSLLANSSPELPNLSEASWELTPPLTDCAPIRARGAFVWPKLSGRGRVAIEGGSALTEEFGVRRMLP